MYDYLKEIPPTYKQEYKSLINNALPTPFGTQERYDFIKYQLIIIAYREENFIGDCVESLINQTTSPYEFEVLIINNCSKEEEFDNTEIVVKEKLEKYKYDNIHLINVKFPKEIAGAALAAKFGIDVAATRGGWIQYDNFNDGIVSYMGADNRFDNHFVSEILKVFRNPLDYGNPHQENPIGVEENRVDVLVTNMGGNIEYSHSDKILDMSVLNPYIENINIMNDLLGKWYHNNFDINWGVKRDTKVNLDKNLLYRTSDGSSVWPKTFRAKIYNDLGGIEVQPQEEQAIIIKAVLNNCVVRHNVMATYGHIYRLEKPRVPDGSITQILHDSSEAYINNSELKAYKLDYWTMRNNIEKYFYEKTFYENWNPTFFLEEDLDKIMKDSGESYLYFKNKFIYQFQDEIKKIYKKISINKVIDDIKKQI
jgi:glycosyltransferase involved in cell wall biosynthesis